ncbi:MAG: polysaccharide biosynthesis tyrosine autokinase [Actinomycetota bacterium]|nr:polysaccharide biosynthesis tyrosine autokinase [Actinomycetota bacterium]
MGAVDYVGALRRRWLVIVAAVQIALVAGFLTTTATPAGGSTGTYTATAVMLGEGEATEGGRSTGLGTAAALTTIGDVPVMVKEEIGFEGDPLTLAAKVATEVNPTAGLLSITATTGDEAQAAVIANAFAENLIEYLEVKREEETREEAGVIKARIDQLEKDIAYLRGRIAIAPEAQREVLEARRSAKVTELSFQEAAFQRLAGSTLGGSQYEIIQNAVPQPAETVGFQAPQTRSGRLILAGVLGLIAGVVLALVLERFDDRLEAKPETEEAFGLPVLAEIPLIPRSKRGAGVIMTASDPRSPDADAFRLLRAGLVQHVAHEEPDPMGSIRSGDRAMTILVTSPGPGDGKTMTVANLAVAFAEMGKKVLVLSCDFRRPEIHRLFAVENDSGLADALQEERPGAILAGHVSRTLIRGVAIVPSGLTPDKPGELLSSDRMVKALNEARTVADVVLLDTAPILSASDAASLVPLVDGVVLIARSRKTMAELAGRTRELLDTIGASLVGVVLNAVRSGSRRNYYGYAAEAEKERRRGFPRLPQQSQKA